MTRRQVRQIAAKISRPLATMIVFVVSMFVGGTIIGEEKAASRAHVEELIRGLDAATLAERSHSERQLLDLGPEILPFLPAPELIESVSAREAVRRIRPQLERRAARESSAPSVISLSGEKSLSDILEQIPLQTKNRISLADDAGELGMRRMAVEWDRTIFWECVDELCQQNGLQWNFSKDAASIRISDNQNALLNRKVVQRTGPFRLEIDHVEFRPIIGEEGQQIVRVVGKLSIEPRLRPLFLSMAVANLKGTVDQRHPLEAWNPDAKYEFPVSDGGHEIPVQWDFRLPPALEAKVLAVRGRLQCQIAAATERIVFDQTSQARGTIRRRGGVTVRLRHVKFEPADADKLNSEIGITVSYDNGGPAFESHRSWIFHNAATLETKSGSRTSFTDFELTQQSDGAIAVDYRWKNLAAPASQYLFVYEAPTLIIDVPVNVDLGGISLNR